MTTIHKEGIRIVTTIITFFVLLSVSFFLIFGNNIGAYIFTAILLILSVFTAFFFRNPKRNGIEYSQDQIISPCDGKVVIVERVYEPEYLNREVLQISVFMSIFNVHVNWFPTKGVVKHYKYHPGKYLVAWHPKSSTLNERTTVVIDNNGTDILVRQIAGLVARRIVCYAKEGVEATQDKEIGFIKFGSRMDIFLPLESEVKVKVGDIVTGTKTLLAQLNSNN